MVRSIGRTLAIIAFLVVALGAAKLASATPTRGFISDTGSSAPAKSCATSEATYELQMGPGGDFAGATVVRVEPTKAASTDIVVMGPGGDFAGATVVKSSSADSTGTDQVIMGPGGDFAGATVVHIAAEVTPDALASTDTQSACG